MQKVSTAEQQEKQRSSPVDSAEEEIENIPVSSEETENYFENLPQSCIGEDFPLYTSKKCPSTIIYNPNEHLEKYFREPQNKITPTTYQYTVWKLPKDARGYSAQQCLTVFNADKTFLATWNKSDENRDGKSDRYTFSLETRKEQEGQRPTMSRLKRIEIRDIDFDGTYDSFTSEENGANTTKIDEFAVRRDNTTYNAGKRVYTCDWKNFESNSNIIEKNGIRIVERIFITQSDSLTGLLIDAESNTNIDIAEESHSTEKMGTIEVYKDKNDSHPRITRWFKNARISPSNSHERTKNNSTIEDKIDNDGDGCIDIIKTKKVLPYKSFQIEKVDKKGIILCGFKLVPDAYSSTDTPCMYIAVTLPDKKGGFNFLLPKNTILSPLQISEFDTDTYEVIKYRKEMENR